MFPILVGFIPAPPSALVRRLDKLAVFDWAWHISSLQKLLTIILGRSVNNGRSARLSRLFMSSTVTVCGPK